MLADRAKQMVLLKKILPWQHGRTTDGLTREDFLSQVFLTLSHLIDIRKEGFSQTALCYFTHLAVFRNPEFYSKQAMRLSVYSLPRGCLDELSNLFDRYEISPVLDDQRCSGRPINVVFRGVLLPEQKPAAQALLAADTGVLSSTTAFGKTVVGTYLISQRKIDTLILVYSSALLAHWRSALEQFLEIDEALPDSLHNRGRKNAPRYRSDRQWKKRGAASSISP